jgi:acetyl-CoA acetyltransferase
VGQTAVQRRTDRSAIQLTYDAILAAVADAGLELKDVDGLTSTLGLNYVPGASDPESYEIAAGLGLQTSWLASEGNVVHAIASGACRHAVVYRTVKEGSGAKSAGGRPGLGMDTMATASGMYAWDLPIGSLSVVNWCAMEMARYMHDYGASRQQLGWIAVTQRAHAALYPLAVYKEPITIDDYLAARIISTPLCLFDCDVPVDSSTAFVYSHVDAVPDLRSPVRIEAQGSQRLAGAAEQRGQLWSRTTLKPGDVDVVQLYDGFSPFVLFGLEAFGFCGPGEAAEFVDGGKRIGRDGELPLNTWGGQLSAGRVHGGIGHLAEAVQQIRGGCGERQIAGAEVSFVGRCVGNTLKRPGGNATLLTPVR